MCLKFFANVSSFHFTIPYKKSGTISDREGEMVPGYIIWCGLVAEATGDVAIGLDAAIAEEGPPAAYLFGTAHVDIYDDAFLVGG